METCPNCKKTYEPYLIQRKRPSQLIQEEYPTATPEQREQLITGICSTECWNKYLGVA